MRYDMLAVLQHCRKLPLFCCLMLIAAGAGAQPEHVLENRVSICVDPATPSRVARNQAEQKRIEGCREWSSFASTSAVLGVLQFRSCSSSVEPVSHFLKAVFEAWNGQSPQNPVTKDIYTSPGKFQLRPIRAGETRVDTLLVWKGMAALVVSEDGALSVKPDLKRTRVLFPGQSNNCGELTVRSAEQLAKSLDYPSEYKFLVPRRPRLYWNHWIESGGVEQPREVTTTDYYRYHISFSALDFEAFRRNDKDAREHLSVQEADEYLPPLDRYKVAVLPIGEFQRRNGFERSVGIDDRILKRTLTQPALPRTASYAELRQQHNGLYVIDENGQRGGSFSYEFRVTNSGCAALAVIVWSETRRTIVTSWIRPLQAIADDAPADGLACAQPGGVSRRMGLAAIPRFDTADDNQVIARLGFIDFGPYTIGSFQDLRYHDEPPISWVLQTSDLRRSLAEFGEFVNRRVKEADFDMHDASEHLARLLFNCRDLGDADCIGGEALRRLRDIGAANPGTRVQANFRDIANNGTYYLPIHLLEQAPGRLLGRNLRFVQPLPVPSAGSARGGCVRDWSGGLIVADVEYFDEGGWRKSWMDSFAATGRYRIFKAFDDLLRLRREYFEDPNLLSMMPEGLILLAHHGNGDISDTQLRDSIERIKADDIKRRFRSGSITVLVACSVGALGDVEKGSSRLLFKLNEKNMRAAIISPFEVPPRLAKRFLEHFKAAAGELGQGASLYDLLDRTKARLRDSSDKADDSLQLKAGVDIFMLVGDSDITICRGGDS